MELISVPDVAGDALRVELLGPNPRDGSYTLSLAEVEVYGTRVPEPSTMGLLLLAGMGAARARRKRS